VTARQRVRALATGGGDDGGIAVPLALGPAARIQERDWEDFTQNPTQLANGLRDLYQAVGPDGLAVTSSALLLEQAVGGLASAPHATAAVEAVRRLRTSLGDQVALVACLPGPASLTSVIGLAADAALAEVMTIGKDFLAAGADVLLLFDGDADASPGLATLGNIARFHQAVVAMAGPARSPFVGAHQSSLFQPKSTDGLVITDTELDRGIDITNLEEWVTAVRA